MRLLSVDWDFFFPLRNPEQPRGFLYDWSHHDGGTFWQETVWTIRAAEFLGRGFPLPRTSGQDKTFWERFRFSPRARLFISDSHAYAAHEDIRFLPIREIYNFDAHHDAGYCGRELQDQVYAENWLLYYLESGVRAKVVYPSWRAKTEEDSEPTVAVPRQIDRGRQYKTPFDLVVISRSAGWTPTWLEGHFWQFVRTCPVQTRRFLQDVKPRKYDHKGATELAQGLNLSVKVLSKQKGRV